MSVKTIWPKIPIGVTYHVDIDHLAWAILYHLAWRGVKRIPTSRTTILKMVQDVLIAEGGPPWDDDFYEQVQEMLPIPNHVIDTDSYIDRKIQAAWSRVYRTFPELRGTTHES